MIFVPIKLGLTTMHVNFSLGTVKIRCYGRIVSSFLIASLCLYWFLVFVSLYL